MLMGFAQNLSKYQLKFLCVLHKAGLWLRNISHESYGLHLQSLLFGHFWSLISHCRNIRAEQMRNFSIDLHFDLFCAKLPFGFRIMSMSHMDYIYSF